ncbi:uncharacterized protein LOC119067256 [Bradysia coprophila]|uniref:uncharacterized protein LOC119067256 n=1 Tax=Bradysia coprophila TaxID=38358 RepID=UPI00187D974C|nr:uncharacterized protein LOC119067256 [Bradysia coprophila]
MNLKVNLFWCCICTIFQQIYSNSMPNIGADCISIFQIVKGVQILCDNKNNATLWQHSIDCHAEISEEFLRGSGEAQCPTPKEVKNPTDRNYSIQEVFFNICGLVQGDVLDITEGVTCLLFGRKDVQSHRQKVDTVKKRFGDKVPCRIGECILGMGLNL